MNRVAWLVVWSLSGGMVALLGGCENLGEMTGLSKASADAIVLTNDVAQTNADETASSEPRPAPKEVWVDDNLRRIQMAGATITSAIRMKGLPP